MAPSAKLITVEGIEGVGKSTALAYIHSLLDDHNIDCVLTREPGGTALAESIRGLLLDKQQEKISVHTELMLMFAARNQHLNLVINPALASGKWVISDRYIDASYAYQAGGRGIDSAVIDQQLKLLENYIHPSCTLLLDADLAVAGARVDTRGKARDRFESEDIEFFARVRHEYLARAYADQKRVKVINANFDIEQVKEQIKHCITQIL
jgi:dTMP kinase